VIADLRQVGTFLSSSCCLITLKTISDFISSGIMRDPQYV